MTFDEFKAVIKDKDNVIYYWNLWQDSRAYGCKNTAAKPVFEDFLNTINDDSETKPILTLKDWCEQVDP